MDINWVLTWRASQFIAWTGWIYSWYQRTFSQPARTMLNSSFVLLHFTELFHSLDTSCRSQLLSRSVQTYSHRWSSTSSFPTAHSMLLQKIHLWRDLWGWNFCGSGTDYILLVRKNTVRRWINWGWPWHIIVLGGFALMDRRPMCGCV